MADLVKRDNPIARYLRETRSELSKVAWPSFEEARNLSLIVIAVTVFMSFALGIVDFLFARLFEGILRLAGQ